ncbi:aminoacyl-tRNA hydrolase [Porphyromonas sp.]|uniref:aminoacyl-tRNA hydrolase n=1 Tax=Porphyromonas sp. TaxID=1924944 RepID=UPI0026DD92C7|nr:aminoacyl-tRNA hydrolase [Porphyromonas sp.]MDO4695253.1 aminoacyl-tRNA hydrolase [Porphyromonas sp.]MDO4771058.1 aminoacyl-tRNA hydrolase [Porphyromonas sp.]
MNNNKYLIVGLGNIGEEYNGTRHNIGFRVVNYLHPDGIPAFSDGRYGATARMRLKNKELILLKPSTYMNLSGNAVRYWMEKENIALENLLVVVDELALPFGTLRLKTKGSAGGHNGLKHISATLGTENYSRLRFGIGSDFHKGGQVDFVLSPFTIEEEDEIPMICDETTKIIHSFCLAGPAITMNTFNKKSLRKAPVSTQNNE